MRFLIVVLSRSSSDTTSSDGGIKSKPSTQSYTEGWDRIFGKSGGSTARN
jgi:hypothetical protein